MKRLISQALNSLMPFVIVAALLAGVLYGGAKLVAINQVAAVAAPAVAAPAVAAPNKPNAVNAPGIYDGKVALKITLGGVFSDTLATPTPVAGQQKRADVGSIDLALFLDQTGNTMSGYIDLGRSVVFSSEHTIQATPMFATPGAGQPTPGPVALKIGPQVQGSYDGTNLSLRSELFSLQVSGRTIQRQFQLTGTRRDTDGNTFAGEYRETLWGYASVPMTVVGEFTISRVGVPIPITASDGGGVIVSNNKVFYLPLVRR